MKIKHLHFRLIVLSIMVIVLLLSPLFNYKPLDIPQIYHDEYGYWSVAAYLNGFNWKGIMNSIPYYSFGYSIILSLILYVSPSLPFAYNIARLLNGLWLALSFLLLRRTALLLFEKSKISNKLITFISFAACCYSSNIVNLQFTWPEEFAMFSCVLVFFALVSFTHRSNYKYLVLLVVSCSCLYYVHQRLIGVSIAAIIAAFFKIIADYKHERISTKDFLLICASFVVGGIIIVFGNYFKSYLIDNLWSNGASSNSNNIESQVQNVKLAFSISGIKLLAKSFCGKAFYIFASSFMIIPLAIVRNTSKLFSIHDQILDFDGDRAISLFVVMSFIFMLAISSITAIQPQSISHLIYGRYNEPLFSILLLIGLVELVTKPISKKECLILLSLMIVLSAIVSNLANHGELKWRDSIMNSGISFFVKDDWIELKKFAIIWICIVFLFPLISRVRYIRIFLILCLTFYWSIMGYIAYRQFESDWGLYQEYNVSLADFINKTELDNNEVFNVIAVNIDAGSKLSRFPADGLQFLSPKRTINVVNQEEFQKLSIDNGTIVVTSRYNDAFDEDLLIYENGLYSVYRSNSK